MNLKFKLLPLVLFIAIPAFGSGVTLKQSTATTINLKLTKIADGTDDTSATVTSITLKIIKHSNTSSTSVTSATCAASATTTDCVHVAGGVWNIEITAAMVDTLGRVTACLLYTGDYTDCQDFEVISAEAYAWQQGAGTDTGPIEAALTDLQGRTPAALGPNGGTLADVRDFNGVAGTFASGRPEIIIQNDGITAGKVAAGTINVSEAPNLDAAVSSRASSAFMDGFVMVQTTIASLASQTSFTLTAGSADNAAYRSLTIAIQDASTATQKASGCIQVYTGASKTVTLLANPGVFTMATGDTVTILNIRCGI